MSQLSRWKIASQFTALLPQLHEFGEQTVPPKIVLAHGLAHRGAGQIRQQERAHHVRGAAWFGNHLQAHGTQKSGHGFAALTRFADGVLKLDDLHVAESNQDMIFTWEMIEEGALPHVS